MIEQLRRTVRWRWPLILAIFVPAALVVVLSVAGRAGPTSAVTVIGVAPERTENATADLVALSLGRYAVEVTSADALDEIAGQTRTDPDVLQDAVTVSVDPDAGTLTVRTDLPDEREAMFVASAVGQYVVGLGDDDTFMDASVLSQPRVEPAGGLASGPVLAFVLALAALLLALAIAYAVELLRPRVRTGGDAARAAGAPVLGSLPPFVSGWPRRTPVDDAEVLKAARALRGGLATGSTGVVGGPLCVVGTDRGAGATTVAFLLARTAADRGESTVLLDLDLEEAGLSGRLELGEGPELGDVLAGRHVLAEAVRHEGAVAVAPVTADPSADGDLDRHLPEVLKQASEQWSLVVVDTGPVSAGDLSESVVVHAESAVVVCRLGSPVSDLVRSAQRLARLGVPLRGVVLNHAGRRDADDPAVSISPVLSAPRSEVVADAGSRG